MHITDTSSASLKIASNRRRLADRCAYLMLSLLLHVLVLHAVGLLPSQGSPDGKRSGTHAEKTGLSLKVALLQPPQAAQQDKGGKEIALALPPPPILIPNGSMPDAANLKPDVRSSLDHKEPWCDELDIPPVRLENALDDFKLTANDKADAYAVVLLVITREGTVGKVKIRETNMNKEAQSQLLDLVGFANFSPGKLGGQPHACEKEYMLTPAPLFRNPD